MKENHIQEPNLFPGKIAKKRSIVWRIVIVLGALFLIAQALEYYLAKTSRLDGKVHAARELEIRTSEEGILGPVNVQNSSAAKAGDLLAVLSNEELGVALLDAIQKKENLTESLKHAEEKVIHAKKRMEAADILIQNGVISRFEYEEAKLKRSEFENDLKATQSEVENLSLRVNALQNKKDALQIRAPFDGIFVGELTPRQGTYLNRGEMLGLFFDPKEFYLEVSLPEGKLTRVRQGTLVRVSFEAFEGIYRGSVDRISADVREETERVYKTVHVAKLRILLESFPEGLKPGMVGRVSFSPLVSFLFPSRKAVER